jgi:hypothetical protein
MFFDPSGSTAGYQYMVRAVKREDGPGGSYYNLSQGAFSHGIAQDSALPSESMATASVVADPLTIEVASIADEIPSPLGEGPGRGAPLRAQTYSQPTLETALIDALLADNAKRDELFALSYDAFSELSTEESSPRGDASLDALFELLTDAR